MLLIIIPTIPKIIYYLSFLNLKLPLDRLERSAEIKPTSNNEAGLIKNISYYCTIILLVVILPSTFNE